MFWVVRLLLFALDFVQFWLTHSHPCVKYSFTGWTFGRKQRFFLIKVYALFMKVWFFPSLKNKKKNMSIEHYASIKLDHVWLLVLSRYFSISRFLSYFTCSYRHCLKLCYFGLCYFLPYPSNCLESLATFLTSSLIVSVSDTWMTEFWIGTMDDNTIHTPTKQNATNTATETVEQ